MASAVSNSAATVGLSSFSVVVALATKSTLVNFLILGTREGHSVVFELFWLRKPNKNEEGHLNHSGRSLFGHVVDGILITEPVTALDRVVPKEELGTIRK